MKCIPLNGNKKIETKKKKLSSNHDYRYLNINMKNNLES